MNNSWNEEGFFSGITEDYSNYKWYKGEKENPYRNDFERPLAAMLWQYEYDFHLAYLEAMEADRSLKKAYEEWKSRLLTEHLPGKSPNPFGDTTDWNKVFETGKIEA